MYTHFSMDNSYLLQLLVEQQNLADFRARAYILDSRDQKRPERDVYVPLLAHFDDFMESDTSPRWITLTWVRGTGKTTLLFQLYSKIRNTDCYTLFLSLDHTYGILAVTLEEVLISYEKSIGLTYETLDKPLVLFLDETQCDWTWNTTLQALMHRSSQIFIYMVGSMALQPKEGVDSSHQIVHISLLPLSSPEYIKITKQKFQIPGLWESIRDAILYSESSQSLYSALQTIAPEVNTFYKGSLQSDVYKYFLYGSLPHLLSSVSEAETYEQIQTTIDRILYRDLPASKFHPDTVSAIPAMLFALSDMDHCNVKKMAEKFALSRSKMSDILDALVWAGLLRRIYPHGPYAQEVVSRKSSKYLFSTPVFRTLYYRLLSDLISNEHAKWKITEDFIAMYFHALFDTMGTGTLLYDRSNGWGNFIVTIDEVSIVVQVGSSIDWYNQIIETRSKIPSKYGIIITENQLDVDPLSGIIRIPLRMFLLMAPNKAQA